MVKDEIYNVLSRDPSYTVSYTQATKAGVRAVLSYLHNLSSHLQWDYLWDYHPDEAGATISICWIEDGELGHITLIYRD